MRIIVPASHQKPDGGGNAPPGGQVLHAAGGGAKLPEEELQQRRHPHPEAGIRVEQAMTARRIRRMNMVCSVSLGPSLWAGIPWATDAQRVRTGGAICPLDVQL
jgi:hypothetical protein